METISKEILKLTWLELNDFAKRIVEISTDDEGNANDEHYIAGCLIDWANDHLPKDKAPQLQDPSYEARMAR
jgi:hypothetical protein